MILRYSYMCISEAANRACNVGTNLKKSSLLYSKLGSTVRAIVNVTLSFSCYRAIFVDSKITSLGGELGEVKPEGGAVYVTVVRFKSSGNVVVAGQ
jgi:hypothetical protein